MSKNSKSHAPASERELSEIIKTAKSASRPLAIKGGGTRPIGNLVSNAETVTTGKIGGITLYEPGALTIVAKAGTTLDEIETTLAAENQHLPFEPADYAGLFGLKGNSTIGGVVAAGVSGPRRIQAGACRDSLIGVRFVSGEGEIIKNGGRVMKNVTGYDLVKLMAGSYGTLGVLTEVSFKVLPKPEVTGVVAVSGLDDVTAVSVLSRALSSPFDVSGAAHLQKSQSGDPLTLIRVEGFAGSIKYRTCQLQELIAPILPSGVEITITMDAATTLKQWREIREISAFHGREGEVWRLSVKPGDGPRVVQSLARQMDMEAVYDWGGGLVWLLVGEPGSASQIRSVISKTGGHATLIRRTPKTGEEVETFHPETGRITELSANLRQQFDPAGILNPGQMAKMPARQGA